MRVSLDKGGKVGVVCSACHFQGFARGQLSDTMIRQSMTPVSRAAMPVPPAGQEIAVPGVVVLPVPAPEPEKAPDSVPAVDPVPAEKPVRNSAFGF
jgi:hypothetical protein